MHRALLVALITHGGSASEEPLASLRIGSCELSATSSSNVLLSTCDIAGLSTSLAQRVQIIEDVLVNQLGAALSPTPPPPPTPPPALELNADGAYSYAAGTDLGGLTEITCRTYFDGGASGTLPTPDVSVMLARVAAFMIGNVGSLYKSYCWFPEGGLAGEPAWTLVWSTGPSAEVRCSTTSTWYGCSGISEPEFRWSGSAWSNGLGPIGASSDPLQQSRVTQAWSQFPVRKMAIARYDASAGLTSLLSFDNPTGCLSAGATLSSGSGICTNNGASHRASGGGITGNGGKSDYVKLNAATSFANCNSYARVAFESHVWDGGDSGVVYAVGYDYTAAAQHSSSCSCPYSNYCGDQITSSSSLALTSMWVA